MNDWEHKTQQVQQHVKLHSRHSQVEQQLGQHKASEESPEE